MIFTKSTLLILLSIMISTLTGCSSDENDRIQSKAYDLMLQTLLSGSVPSVSVDSLKHLRDNVVLLDTRSRNEYEVSHIKGAQFVGYKSFDSTKVAGLPKDTAIVAYCAVGYRSEKIAEQLQQMGFTNVKNLYGGVFEWKNQGNTVVTDNGPTDKVHAYDRLWGRWLNKGKKVYEK